MRGFKASEIRKILVIDLGQLGDVILSFPALTAIREAFPKSDLTIFASKATFGILRELRSSDDIIVVDRVELVNDHPLTAIWKIFRLLAEVRRRHFDLVIDLHSLYETNLLGFVSRARHRLFANREGRSLDFLANFHPRPEKEDKSRHLSDFYLSVLAPLGIQRPSKRFRLNLPPHASDEFLNKYCDGRPRIGFVVGAGHSSRRWPLERFAALSGLLSDRYKYQQLVFLGPEEEAQAEMIRSAFGDQVTVVRGLSLSEVAAALGRLDLLISNDTGPSHLAAIVGTPIVLVMDEQAPLRYLPLADPMKVVRNESIGAISVADVYSAATDLLDGPETNMLPAS